MNHRFEDRDIISGTNRFELLQAVERLGDIEQCTGLKLISNGPAHTFVGEICELIDSEKRVVMQAEVIGFKGREVFLMPFGNCQIGRRLKVRATGKPMSVNVGDNLLGRVIDGLGKPLDGGKPIENHEQMPLYRHKINPLERERISERIYTGIQAIDSLCPLGKGQRIGLFAGSGVGKSVLLGMMAKNMESDVNVIALVGERGREVNDFIQNNLDEATRKKSVIIVACSDDFAMMRKYAVFTATAIAEYFCKQGKDVMLLLDSITRFAMAQREVGLSLNEPPTARGYTPSVFSILPGLLERAGNFSGQGSISAVYTVLVEGDDFNEPIADTMRALLDGHIVLTRELAHRGHYPAIDILQSVSRLRHQLTSHEEETLITNILALLNLYEQNRDLIELGAYRQGHHKKLDFAVTHIQAIWQLMRQNIYESLPLSTVLQRFSEILL